MLGLTCLYRLLCPIVRQLVSMLWIMFLRSVVGPVRLTWRPRRLEIEGLLDDPVGTLPSSMNTRLGC